MCVYVFYITSVYRVINDLDKSILPFPLVTIYFEYLVVDSIVPSDSTVRVC